MKVLCALWINILEYCSSVWSPYTKVSARKIEQVQRLATKIIEKQKNVSYSDRHCIIGNNIISSVFQHFN